MVRLSHVALLDDVPEQGGLAGSVGSDERDALSARNVHVGVVEQLPVTEGLTVAAHLEGDVGPGRLGREVGVNGPRAQHGLVDGLSLLALQLRPAGPEPSAPGGIWH